MNLHLPPGVHFTMKGKSMHLDDRISRPLKLLLVEDNRIQVILVRAALTKLPTLELMQVVEDGAQAIEFLNLKNRCENGELPHLILLDINMPRKDGFAVLAELKSNPAFSKIPVVMFTSSSSQEDVERAYAEGANSFVTKPETLADLEQVLRGIADYWVKTARLPGQLTTNGNSQSARPHAA